MNTVAKKNEGQLKHTLIGNVVITWNKTIEGDHVVEAIVHGPKLSEVVKTWEFKSKKTSLYFYDYVVRTVQQHVFSNANSIPKVLMNMSTKDAEEAIASVLLHLSK